MNSVQEEKCHPKQNVKFQFPSLFLSFCVNSSTTHLMWANVSQTKFISCTDIPERSLINALDGDLGADEKLKRLCKNNASHPHSGCCLRQRNDTSGEENEQLCVLIDHRTSSTQLGLSYQDVLSLLECIKSLHPTKQLEQDVLWKVAGSDDTVIELIVFDWLTVLFYLQKLSGRSTAEEYVPEIVPKHYATLCLYFRSDFVFQLLWKPQCLIHPGFYGWFWCMTLFSSSWRLRAAC